MGLKGSKQVCVDNQKTTPPPVSSTKILPEPPTSAAETTPIAVEKNKPIDIVEPELLESFGASEMDQIRQCGEPVENPHHLDIKKQSKVDILVPTGENTISPDRIMKFEETDHHLRPIHQSNLDSQIVDDVIDVISDSSGSSDDDDDDNSSDDDEEVTDWIDESALDMKNDLSLGDVSDSDSDVQPNLVEPTRSSPVKTAAPRRIHSVDPKLAPVITPSVIRDTKIVKKKKAAVPKRNLPHPTPKFGDWLNSRRMINNYIILESLGAGSYAEVKLCKEKTSGRLFAMKFISRDIMKSGLLGKQNPFEDIKREIAIMKKLNHPNVLRLFEVMDDPNVNKLYLVLEYMHQGDLLTMQRSKSTDGTCMPMDDNELHCVLLQVLLGLMYLHDQKVVHGDIKPQNLLVGDHGRVKIADFGISQSLYGSKQKLLDSAGTPAFMSPEMCSGEEYSGQQADIWAVGATIFMLKFGRPPFVAKTAVSIFEKIQHDPLEFPCVIDGPLRNLLTAMLTKDPTKRITLLQAMQHPWVTKDMAQSIRIVSTPIVSSIVVSSDDIDNAIFGTDRFNSSKASEVDSKMLNHLQTARQRLLIRHGVSPPTKRSIPCPKQPLDKQQVLSPDESTYRLAVFASKKDPVTKEEEEWESSDDEEAESLLNAHDDDMLMTALCLPGFEHKDIRDTTLDTVVEDKQDARYNENLQLEIGAVSKQGCRSTQEDRYVVLEDIQHPDVAHMSFTAVYDGHGGTKCSTMLEEKLHDRLFELAIFPQDIRTSFIKVCKDIDKVICTELQSLGDMSGSTATFALVTRSDDASDRGSVYIGHVGDCRAILRQSNGEVKVLTKDHRPTLKDERDRVCESGGKIVNDRVNGVLAITRAFGDIEFKGLEHKQIVQRPDAIKVNDVRIGKIVTSIPDIVRVDLTEIDEFLIIACDGLWDVMSNEDAAEFVRKSLQVDNNSQEAATQLAQTAIKLHSRDNVTVIVLHFNQKRKLLLG